MEEIKKKRGAFFRLKPISHEEANREFLIREQQRLFEEEKAKFAKENKWNEYANGLKRSSTWKEAVEYYKSKKAECEAAAKDWEDRVYKRTRLVIDFRSDEDLDGRDSRSANYLNERRRRNAIKNLLHQADEFESFAVALMLRVGARI